MDRIVGCRKHYNQSKLTIMNKTVNINIGGLFFNVDENAFQKLSSYLDAIKRSLSNPSGQDEIMKDIEMRIAELLAEKQKTDKHVVSLKDVDEVILVMGQPEDYRIDDESEEPTKTTFTSSTSRTSKKLYRDKDKGMIGGVCTGLGHYFGVDAVWIKILFLIFVFAGFGTGILAYFILWVVTPEAITTSEKLEMTGEPVTISNIEKKVREEFESVSEKLKNVDQKVREEYENMSEKFKNANPDLANQFTSGANSVGKNFGDVIVTIFGAFAKVLGAIIVMFASFSLLAFCIACIVLMFSTNMPENYILNHIQTPIGLETPLWIQGILYLLVFGIPLFFFLILGLKLLLNNLKSIGSIAKYSLLALWVIALGILISLGINEATQIAFEGKTVQKQEIVLQPTDTLFIKFKNNDFYSKNIDYRDDFKLTQDESGKDVIYSNNVSIKLMPTDEKVAFIQIEKLANGKSASEAKERAEKINYAFEVKGNQLILNNYLINDVKNKFRGQQVELFLYLPIGTYVKPDQSMENYDQTDSDYFYWHPNQNEVYKVNSNKMDCVNCLYQYEDVKTENINSINENDSIKEISIKINGKEVIQTKKGKPGLEINQDGIIVKTN